MSAQIINTIISMHSSILEDNLRSMYVFNESVISDRLINALEEFYIDRDNSKSNSNLKQIKLVPSDSYFLCYKYNEPWFYKDKIYITKEQVDKYLKLYEALQTPFLEYIEIVLGDIYE